MEQATQQDIQNLRQDIQNTERRLQAAIDKQWADQRDTLSRHAAEDKTEFAAVREEIVGIKTTQDNWAGAINSMKFFAMLGGGSCLTGLAALVVHVIRHW
jgi:hypothetical protein